MLRPERQFWHLLARTVLHCSVAEAQERLDSQEFDEWQAMYGIEPWGNDWLQTGTLASLLYNPKRRRGSRAMKFIDWIPRIYKRPKQTVNQMLGIMKFVSSRMTGSGK